MEKRPNQCERANFDLFVSSRQYLVLKYSIVLSVTHVYQVCHRVIVGHSVKNVCCSSSSLVKPTAQSWTPLIIRSGGWLVGWLVGCSLTVLLRQVRFRESYFSVNMSCESSRLMKSSSNWVKSGEACSRTFQWSNEIFVLARFSRSTTSCLKNVPPLTLTCYNLDTHEPIAIIFGRSVTDKVRNQMMHCFPISKNPFTCVKVIAGQMWDIFETRCS